MTAVDTTILQGALRLLFLLERAGKPVGEKCPVQGAVRTIRSEKRLQALDFWMRTPDYLAAEILSMVESRDLDRSDLAIVQRLLSDGEPDLRRYPMVRWHFGAYEPIDDAFSMLVTPGLAVSKRFGNPMGRRRSDFFLLEKGLDATMALVSNEPTLKWYQDRAGLVARIAGADSGDALKRRQYKHEGYSGTAMGSRFTPITDVVRQRLSQLSERS